MSAVKPKTKCALIQRSCGYSWRRSLSVNDIGRAIKIIKVRFHSRGTLAVYLSVLLFCKAITFILKAFCSLKFPQIYMYRAKIPAAQSWWTIAMVNLLKALNLPWWYVIMPLSCLVCSIAHLYCTLVAGCRFDRRQFDQESRWNDCTMWWICCWEAKMG